MATLTLKIKTDERYPDFTVYPKSTDWDYPWELEVSLTEEEYNAVQDATERYDTMQVFLEGLYDRARKDAKTKKANS